MAQTRRLKRCGLYAPGHEVHWIQAHRSSEDAENRPSRGTLIDVADDGVLTVEIDGQRLSLWNHDPVRLIDVISLNGPEVSYQPRWGLLRSPHDFGYLFCVVDAEADRRTCPEAPPTGDLLELLESAGGFSIRASSLLTEQSTD